MPAGRPTKYNEAMLKKAEEYLHTYENYEHAFPSLIGLASVLGVRSSTIYEWQKDPDKQDFSEILDRILQEQQRVAWYKGLTGQYNANLVKLLLGKHGYSEKHEQEISGPGGGAIKTDNTWTVKIVDTDANASDT